MNNPQDMLCPVWHIRNSGKATAYGFVDVLIESETENGQEKICRVGSEIIHVPFKEIDEESEIWKVGERGTLWVTHAGFERIFYDGFLKKLAVGQSVKVVFAS